MGKVTLKKAMETMGYEIVQYHKNYNQRSGFAKKDGQLYYFSYEDLRWNPTLMIRTANPEIKNKKGQYADYTGGMNTYPSLSRYNIEIREKRIGVDGA